MHKRRIFVTAIIMFLSLNLFGQINPGVKHTQWSRNATIYEVNIRQYTPEGTFKAFEKHLPRLKKMGVKILWLMPIHPIGEKNRKGTLGSYYAVKDYLGINPEFGTASDFKHLINTAHAMGMYVIIDWVANHTAWDNVWTKTHPEFYNKDKSGNFYPPVKGWQDVIDLNYDNKQLWTAMVNALKYWVKEFNIDGYRCDVASMVPLEFWNFARKELEKVKPVFMLAEAQEPELHEHAFDMTYNWQLKDLMNAMAKKEKSVDDLRELIKKEHQNYPRDAYRMNFITNHDENSWNGTVFERLGNKAKIFAVLTGVLEGMPLVYSGQEAGLNKALRFFDKDTIEWRNHPFKELYGKLFNLKLNNKALWNGIEGGTLRELEVTGNKGVFAFVRSKEENTVIAVFNFGDDEKAVNIKLNKYAGEYIDFNTKENVSVPGIYNLQLPAWNYKILYK